MRAWFLLLTLSECLVPTCQPFCPLCLDAIMLCYLSRNSPFLIQSKLRKPQILVLDSYCILGLSSYLSGILLCYSDCCSARQNCTVSRLCWHREGQLHTSLLQPENLTISLVLSDTLPNNPLHWSCESLEKNNTLYLKWRQSLLRVWGRQHRRCWFTREGTSKGYIAI